MYVASQVYSSIRTFIKPDNLESLISLDQLGFTVLLSTLFIVLPYLQILQRCNALILILIFLAQLAKDISTTKLWRRISIINGRRTSSEIDMINIKLRKVFCLNIDPVLVLYIIVTGTILFFYY